MSPTSPVKLMAEVDLTPPASAVRSFPFTGNRQGAQPPGALAISQGGEVVSHLVHTQEIAGANPAPASHSHSTVVSRECDVKGYETWPTTTELNMVSLATYPAGTDLLPARRRPHRRRAGFFILKGVYFAKYSTIIP